MLKSKLSKVERKFIRDNGPKYKVKKQPKSNKYTFNLHLQAGHSRLQVAARSSSIVPGRRLPADRGLRTPPASLRSRQRPHCSENKHSTWRPEFLGRESENLEQSTRFTAAA